MILPQVRIIKGWGGDPIIEHRMLEFFDGYVYARLWLRPFTKPYHFSNYGPHCFGFAWFSGMIYFKRKAQ